MAGTLSWKRLLGAARLRRPGGRRPFVPALVLAALTVCVLIAVIGAEQTRRARRRARGEPSPLERLAAETKPLQALEASRRQHEAEHEEDAGDHSRVVKP